MNNSQPKIDKNVIAIAGPGRSGTSFLTEFLSNCNFSAPNRKESYFERVKAGLESRITRTNIYEIQKDPWLVNYIEDLEKEDVANIKCLLIPIRDLQEAASSRSINETLSRVINGQDDHWAWETQGDISAGAIYSIDSRDIADVLARQLWKLILEIQRFDIPLVFIEFHQMMSNFDYLWTKISDFISARVSKEDALKIWKSLVDLNYINFENSKDDSHFKIIEQKTIIRKLVEENRALQEQLKAKQI